MKNISGGYRSSWWAWFIEKFLKRDKIWLLLKNRKNGKHHVRQLPLFVWHSEVKCPSSKFSNFFITFTEFLSKGFLKRFSELNFGLIQPCLTWQPFLKVFAWLNLFPGYKFSKGVFFVLKCFNFGSVCAEIRTTISQN